MLPKLIEQLALDIASYRDARERKALGDTSGRSKKLVQEDPEACLASLLERIKEELPVISSTLYDTVDRGFFKEHVEEAREKLQQTS